MKKIISALVLSIVGTAGMVAQSNIFNNPDNEAYFGVRVGLDIACPGDVKSNGIGLDAFSNGAGIEFGGIYNLPLVANLYLEPGLKLFYDTYSLNKDYLSLIGTGKDVKSSIGKFGMRIPVMVGYHFDFTDDIKVSVFTGPELEVGFTAKNHTKIGSISSSESIYGEDSDYNRVNLLWGIGAGVEYKHFYLGVGGGIGMLNMFKDSEATFHENRVTISLGYNF